MPTVTFKVNRSGTTAGGTPPSNSILVVRRYTTNEENNRSFVSFDLSSIPSNAIISSATLSLYFTRAGNTSGTYTINISPATKSIVNHTVLLDNDIDTTPSVSTSIGRSDVPIWKDVSVTGAVTQMLSLGICDFVLWNVNNQYANFYITASNGMESNRPSLVISYTIPNTAPTTPSSITVPELRSGNTATVSWGASTDADGNTINYYLERSINGGVYSIIRSGGTTRTFNDTPQVSWNTVAYRVRAYDGTAYSSYRTSSTVTVKHFPELKVRIDGALKTSDNGWVRVDGALRKIDKIWTRVDGSLKEV